MKRKNEGKNKKKEKKYLYRNKIETTKERRIC